MFRFICWWVPLDPTYMTENMPLLASIRWIPRLYWIE